MPQLQQWLLDYEADHPEDVTGDTCILCSGSEQAATDWISCDSCGSWVRTCHCSWQIMRLAP
jgi:hypothetical protein